jgi:hypothetical protein
MARQRRLVCVGCGAFVGLMLFVGSVVQTASAVDTPNVLMTIDAMTLTHAGLFRNATPNDGYNTFQFGPVLTAGGTLGKYRSFYMIKNATGDGGISHNARFHSDTPEITPSVGGTFAPAEGVDLDTNYIPWIDRSAFGQVFDPNEYQIEVKFKPNIGVAGLPSNTAPFFQVGLDQVDGFVFDSEAGTYKRANDAFSYNIGATTNAINDWYTTAPKDADGYATWTVPVTSPDFVQRGFYYAFGSADFRTSSVVTGGGRDQGADVNDGLDALSFGGGAVDPNASHAQIKAPNGVPLISLGAPAAETGLSIQLKYASLKRITSTPIVARIDKNSGFTFKFGSGFTYGTTQPPIVINGFSAYPNATDQVSRFDQNGMTNLIFNERSPDAANEVHRFFIRGGPNAEVFDGTKATVNIRAKLLPSNTATTLTIVAKDLDGSDATAGTGADEYTKSINLSQFNSSTFTTISIPLSTFDLSGTNPFGFTNSGDGQKTNFDLYEFGGLLPAGGLLRMELEFMEIRLDAVGVPGDYNNNGIVDASDYVLWRDHSGTAFQLQNEVTSTTPGQVTVEDYNAWRTRFGNNSGSGSGAAVPEPGCWLLFAISAMVAGVHGRRRQDNA